MTLSDGTEPCAVSRCSGPRILLSDLSSVCARRTTDVVLNDLLDGLENIVNTNVSNRTAMYLADTLAGKKPHVCFGEGNCALLRLILLSTKRASMSTFDNTLYLELCGRAITEGDATAVQIATCLGVNLGPSPGLSRARVLVYDILHSLGRKDPKKCIELILAVAQNLPLSAGALFMMNDRSQCDPLQTAIKYALQDLICFSSVEVSEAVRLALGLPAEIGSARNGHFATLLTSVRFKFQNIRDRSDVWRFLRTVSLEASLSDPEITYQEILANILWPDFASNMESLICFDTSSMTDRRRFHLSNICRAIGTIIAAVDVCNSKQLRLAYSNVENRLADLLRLQGPIASLQPAIALALVDILQNSNMHGSECSCEETSLIAKRTATLLKWRQRLSIDDLSSSLSREEVAYLDLFLSRLQDVKR